ncbi:MAG: M23 family metallopeptidase [Bdellovibrionales bacterium]
MGKQKSFFKKFLLKKKLLWALAIVIGLFSFKILLDQTVEYEANEDALEAETLVESVEDIYPHLIVPGTTLYADLLKLNVSGSTIHKIVQAAKPVMDLKHLKPGVRFQLFYIPQSMTELASIKFRFSPVETLEVRNETGNWVAEKITAEVETKITHFMGYVTSSLWESAENAKMDPNLISELAEIFGWQVDFAREVRANDRWRLLVEQKFVKDEPYGWGSIIAAEYVNAGQAHSAALLRVDGKDMGYFAPDGSSLRRMFLKSPIRYGRISSRFQRKRFHPILKIMRAHQGVDYAAPQGTPIRAVGDGVVKFVGWSGGGGKVIKIRHNSTYETAYKHLSGFAKGLRSGSSVQQGQVIGYVGNTGLSTASHLHFEFFVSGRFVDPLGRKFPTAEPVPSKFLSVFKTEALTQLANLPPWQSIVPAREPATY